MQENGLGPLLFQVRGSGIGRLSFERVAELMNGRLARNIWFGNWIKGRYW